MQRIMDLIAKETNGKSYHTYKFCYDKIGVPAIDYDEDKKVIKWEDRGETENHVDYINLKEQADNLHKFNSESIFKYFLDGSRRVFKVDDISYGKQVFPVIAGQVGVGCCARENKVMRKELIKRDLVIALPDKCDPDGWNNGYLASKLEKINNMDIIKNLNLNFSDILMYKTASKDTATVNFEDLAIAQVQDYMIDCEKKVVEVLVKENKLGQDSYLIKDGSLEYMDTKKYDKRSLQKIKNNYNWVIGISKKFNPETIKDYTGKKNANYIADLPLYARTPVARYKSTYSKNVEFGVWYIRIRDKKDTLTPFDGVVKVEKILMDDEYDYGIDSDTIDLISANIINERAPTCYGKDSRWANHLYPVFVTESYVKSNYMSNEMFMHLF